MKYYICRRLLVSVFGLVCCNSAGYGQTLFQRPDTTPNYASYKNFDQCLEAVNRIILGVRLKDTIWVDTAAYDPSRNFRPVPEDAIKFGRMCLSGMNLDSVPTNDYDLLIRVLLLLNMDDVVNRIVHNALNTTPPSAKNSLFNTVMEEYRRATPKRLYLLKDLLERDDSPFSTTASEGGDVWREILLARTAWDLGQASYPMTVAKDIMNKEGKYATQLKKMSDRDLEGSVYPFLMEVIEFLTDEADDSLRASTLAYSKVFEEVWSRISSKPLPAAIQKSLSFIGATVPQISGDFWYTNLDKHDSDSGNINSQKIKKISPQAIPIAGKVNVIVFLHGGCHSRSEFVPKGRKGSLGGGGTRCWTAAALIKRLKQRFPEIQVAVVSKTFGSIGNAPPLEPQDEADTLADYFLNFYKIPGIHIVAKTDFMRIPGYDRRRIDLEVPYELDLTFGEEKLGNGGNVLIVDEIGRVVHSVRQLSGRSESLIARKVSAVLDRIKRKL